MLLVVGIMATCLIPLAVGAYFMRESAERLLGLNPDAMQKVADNQRAVNDKKKTLKREEEKKAPERKAEMVADAETTPPKAEPVSPELSGDKASSAVASKPDSSPKPAGEPVSEPAPQVVTDVRPSIIKPLFCQIQDPVSAIGGEVAQEPIRLEEKNFVVDSMELLGDAGLEQSPGHDDPQSPWLRIFSPSSDPQVASPKELATFRLTRPTEIGFAWDKTVGPGERPSERARLRDCILKITSKKKTFKFCVLHAAPSPPQYDKGLANHVDYDRQSGCKAAFYKWDAEGHYRGKLAELSIENCALMERNGKVAFSLERVSGGSCQLARHGERLLTVELGRITTTSRSGKQKKALDTDLTSDNARSEASNTVAVVVVKLFHADPMKIEKDIETINEEIKRFRRSIDATEDSIKDRGGDSEDKEKKIHQAEKEIERNNNKIRRLEIIKKIRDSSIRLSIAKQIAGLKLEIARLDAMTPIPWAGIEKE